MKRSYLGLIAVIIGTLWAGLITLKLIPKIEMGDSPTGFPYSHVYLIFCAIIIAGGLITDAIGRRR